MFFFIIILRFSLLSSQPSHEPPISSASGERIFNTIVYVKLHF